MENTKINKDCDEKILKKCCRAKNHEILRQYHEAMDLFIQARADYDLTKIEVSRGNTVAQPFEKKYLEISRNAWKNYLAAKEEVLNMNCCDKIMEKKN